MSDCLSYLSAAVVACLRFVRLEARLRGGSCPRSLSWYSSGWLGYVADIVDGCMRPSLSTSGISEGQIPMEQPNCLSAGWCWLRFDDTQTEWAADFSSRCPNFRMN